MTKSESLGYLALILILLMMLSGAFFRMYQPTSLAHHEDVRMLDSLVGRIEAAREHPPEALFTFDPNTISEDSLKLLGFQPYIAARIVKYRQSGGQFRVKKDLLKIYDISTDNVQRVWAGIQLPDSLLSAKPEYNPSTITTRSRTPHIDINRATADELIALRGIGTVLAGRTIKYRDLLGGYVSPDQFAQIYHMTDEGLLSLQNMTTIAEGYVPVQIDLKKSQPSQWQRHPYISKEISMALYTCISDSSIKKQSQLEACLAQQNIHTPEILLRYIRFE